MEKHQLQIVSASEIPLAQETPINDLLSVFRLITKMEKICTDNGGIGLSAVQVGVPWKLFIVNRNNKYEYYLNCEYVGVGDKSKSIESCLSLRNESGDFRRFELDRFPAVLVTGQQLKISDSPSLLVEKFFQLEQGLIGVVFQHEIDHFFGREKMIDKIGKEIEINTKYSLG